MNMTEIRVIALVMKYFEINYEKFIQTCGFYSSVG